MRVFLTGGTGFIGGHVAAQAARTRRRRRLPGPQSATRPPSWPSSAASSSEGDLSDEAAIRAGLEGADAVIHGAAIYEVGIPKSDHQPMYDANVVGTENVLRAALDAKMPRVVYISTIGAFGNTHGEVVDETYRHPGVEFTSYYEETKYQRPRDRQAADRARGFRA